MCFELPDKVRIGSEIEAHIRVAGGVLLKGCLWRTRVIVSGSLCEEIYEAEDICCGCKEAVFTLSSVYPGTLTVRASQVMLTDIFGLVSLETDIKPSVRCVQITPELKYMSINLTGEAGGGRQAATVSPIGMDYSGVRDYRPGDNVRRIHWKLSEKLAKTLIREISEESSNLILLLDSYVTGSCGLSGRAETLTGFISLAQKLTGTGKAFTAVMNPSAPVVLPVENGTDFERLADTALSVRFTQSEIPGIEALYEALSPASGTRLIVFSVNGNSACSQFADAESVTFIIPGDTASENMHATQ